MSDIHDGEEHTRDPLLKSRLKKVKSEALTNPTATPKSEPLASAKDPEAEEEEEGVKWEYFEHNGVHFPENWKRHNVPVLFRGQKLQLDALQEEMASYWAQTLGTDWETKPFYVRNFTQSFLNTFDAGSAVKTAVPEATLQDFDFGLIKAHLAEERERKAELTAEQKARAKEEKERVDNRYKYIIVDDRLEKVANFRIEPPTLFKGRGEHPKAGFLKQRAVPEDIEINLSKDSVVPVCHLPGRAWDAVTFKDDAIWLACYNEEITGAKKYIQLGASSLIKVKNDMKKYERARRLKSQIERIRGEYRKMMGSESMRDKQLGTAAYFIDFLAIRAGNEKKEDEADTVGCCSLRKEHVAVLPENRITLDFLGKDSMRYFNTVAIDPLAHRNVELFLRNKDPKTEVFDLIDSSKLNDYLHELMDELTAKVFRTFNASNTLQNELERTHAALSPGDSLEAKLEAYNQANKSVAILCNHQKGVSKATEESLEKAKAAIKELKAELKQCKGDARKSAALKERVRKAEKALELRESNKSVALSTSKINYNDPRISVAWCKRFEVPIEKVFTNVLLEKFKWAMEFESNWRF